MILYDDEKSFFEWMFYTASRVSPTDAVSRLNILRPETSLRAFQMSQDL